MQESTIYRSIQQEAKVDEKRSIAFNFLYDGLPVEAVARSIIDRRRLPTLA